MGFEPMIKDLQSSALDQLCYPAIIYIDNDAFINCKFYYGMLFMPFKQPFMNTTRLTGNKYK